MVILPLDLTDKIFANIQVEESFRSLYRKKGKR